MEIVDKTKETWKIGDIVIDNDERKGIIKKTKDDDFVIVRIDEKHVGDYFSGLAYEAGINMYCLQRKASEFHKVNDNNGNEEWQTGDRMTVATREKCPCCDFDSDGFGKNIIGKGYGSCEIRLYRATKYDFYIYSYSVGAEALLKDWFEIYSQKVRFCPVCGRRLAID